MQNIIVLKPCFELIREIFFHFNVDLIFRNFELQSTILIYY